MLINEPDPTRELDMLEEIQSLGYSTVFEWVEEVMRPVDEQLENPFCMRDTPTRDGDYE